MRVLPFVPLGRREQAPPYPGRLIKRDSADRGAVRKIQQRLRDLGYARSASDPRPLEVDGQYAPIRWRRWNCSKPATRICEARHWRWTDASARIRGGRCLAWGRCILRLRFRLGGGCRRS